MSDRENRASKPGKGDISHLVHVILSGRTFASIFGPPPSIPLLPPHSEHESQEGPPNRPVAECDFIPPEHLPTIHALAGQHAVYTKWSSEATDDSHANNRLFAMTGSFGGSSHLSASSSDSEPNPIFSIMDEHHGHRGDQKRSAPTKSRNADSPSDWSWRVYSYLPYLDSFTLLFPKLALSELVKDVYCQISDLAKHAECGTLAAYSLVEPLLLPTQINGQVRLPNNQNPTNDRAPWPSPPVWEADRMILELYKALFGPKAIHRHSTLLIITYVESEDFHGHHLNQTDVKHQRPHISGGRVPTILVSPLIEPGTSISATFNHSSVLSSIVERWGNPGPLAGPSSADSDHSTIVLSSPTIWGVIKQTLSEEVKNAYDLQFQDLVKSCEARLSILDEIQRQDVEKLHETTAEDPMSPVIAKLVSQINIAASSSSTILNVASLLSLSTGPSGEGGTAGEHTLLEHISARTTSFDAARFVDAARAPSCAKTADLASPSRSAGKNQDPTMKKGVKRALLIGPSYFDRKQTSLLDGPSNDVGLMKKLLYEFNGFALENIKTVEGEEASFINIRLEFESIVKKTLEDDILVFFFSGLGCRVPSADTEPIEAFLPSFRSPSPRSANIQVSAISFAYILRWLDHLQAKIGRTDNVTLIFDCCHSADLLAVVSASQLGIRGRWNLKSFDSVQLADQGLELLVDPILLDDIEIPPVGDDTGPSLDFYHNPLVASHSKPLRDDPSEEEAQDVALPPPDGWRLDDDSLDDDSLTPAPPSDEQAPTDVENEPPGAGPSPANEGNAPEGEFDDILTAASDDGSGVLGI